MDAWVATAGPDGPWMVPLSFAWDGGRLLFATAADSRTVRNLAHDARVRISLGGTRDVVMVDGTAAVAPADSLTDDELALFGGFDSDPREWATAAIRVQPIRIQAWREENELAGRTIMEHGEWSGHADATLHPE